VHAGAGGGADEERERESQADAIQPNAGLDPTTMRSRPEPKPRVGHLTDCTTQVPPDHFKNE